MLIYVSILLFLLILIIYSIWKYRNNYLTGFWVGEEEFLKTSNLKDFQLFIDIGKKSRDGYILIIDINDNIVINQTINIEFSHITRSVKINTDTFPDNLKFTLNVSDGSLMMYSDKIYAFLVKDLNATMQLKE